ncbi:MAG: hypothetical protein IPH86_08315 [bacterium]|nr:hypothetical protein [bacterium]
MLMLYQYGHDLDPTAALKIKPFMPVIVGTKQVANFTTQSYPLAGTVLVGLYAAGIVFLTGWHFFRGERPLSGSEAGAGDC